MDGFRPVHLEHFRPASMLLYRVEGTQVMHHQCCVGGWTEGQRTHCWHFDVLF